MEQEATQIRQQNKEMIAQENKHGLTIMRETKHHEQQTDGQMVQLKLKHDEYNYVRHNLTLVETKEDLNRQKREEMNMKIEVAQ